MISRTAIIIILFLASTFQAQESVHLAGVRGRSFHKIPMLHDFDCSTPCKNRDHSTDGLRGVEMAKCLVQHCGSFYGDVQVPLADDFIYDNFNHGQCKAECDEDVWMYVKSTCLDVCECKRGCWVQRSMVPRKQRVCAETCGMQRGQISAAVPHFHS